MNKSLKYVFIFFLLLLNLFAQEKKVVYMCVDPNWMPLEGLKNGKYVGISSEYFKLFKSEFKLPIEVVQTNTWSQTMHYIQEKKCDMVSLIYKTDSREKFLNFTKPYLKVSVALIAKMDTPYISDLRQLTNKKVAIVQNYAFIDFVKKHYPNLKIVAVKSIQEGLQDVVDGKVYGYIGALPVIVHKLQTQFSNVLKILDVIDNAWELSVGVRNDNMQLYKIMQKAVNSVNSQTQLKIFNKYMPIKYEKASNYREFFTIIGIFVLVFLIGFLFYLKLLKLKNKILKQNRALVSGQRLLREREKELELLATTDYLTKLYNRRAFGKVSDSVFNLTKREKQKFSILMIDIDDFKKINDTYGHKVGDDVLVALSKTLQENSRQSDIVCRYGGEEFILLLPKTDLKGAFFIAHKIKDAVESLRVAYDNENSLRFTISLGVSEVNLQADKNIEAVIKRADDALYISKKEGKNRVTTA